MSSSTPIRFLLDENVRIELTTLLSEQNIDFTVAKKSSGDKTLASISVAEERIVVTNDTDFSDIRKGDVFGVVWLRLPQNDPELLVKEFSAMLAEKPRYADSLVILAREKRRVVPLPVRIRFGRNS